MTAHPTCTTCQRWTEPNEWDVPDNFKRCAAAPMSCDMWQWDEDRESKIARPEYAATTMAAMDGSSYNADVYTRGDHYCPMHSSLAADLPAQDGGEG